MHGNISYQELIRNPRLWRRIKSSTQIKALKRAQLADAREDFWAFRQLIDPRLKLGWWTEDLAYELQDFYHDFKKGLRPKIVVMAPPQHGKSTSVIDFTAWLAGKNPNLNTIFTSYSDRRGIAANTSLQRIMFSQNYQRCFHLTRIPSRWDEAMDGDEVKSKRNTSRIEYAGHKGSFYNTTVGGQITGFGMHIGLVDDPIKGRAAAQSLLIRDKTWDWLVFDFFSRLDDSAGVIMVMTRWHVDDPIGRFLEKFPETRVLRYTAIAEKNDWSVKEGHRNVGDPLFPEFKSKEFLDEQRALHTNAGWEALFQQSPIVVGGGMFPVDNFNVMQVVQRNEIKKSVRYWDKAAVEGGGSYTAGVLMHETKEGRFVIEDVVHGQWSALDREKRIRQTAEIDKGICPLGYQIHVEQEQGSGGKESAEATIRSLKGFKAFADRVSGQGSKEIRAEPYAAQVQNGNVWLKAAPWNRGYLNECEEFPNGKYKDQVDASSGAFNKLVGVRNNSLSWIE